MNTDASDRRGEAYNTTGLYSDSRQAPYNMVRSERSQLLSKMTFPRSYTSNTVKEVVCLDFVEAFRAQYAQLYPQRPPLLLSPMNECLRPKFVSTFIRPTLLPYLDTYDYDQCAKFISGYITYDPLEDPETLPQRVVSPTTVLAWQVGNCVEMSILLSSVLVAAGYNAVVVVGYATRDVVECDLSDTPWPGKLPVETYSEDDTDKPDITLNTKFAVNLKQRPKLVSAFDAEEAERARERAALSSTRRNEYASDNSGAAPTAPAKRLCHCWVAILPNRRVANTMFIEPSTGATVPLSDSRYQGVEAIFNQYNYFVNMEPQTPPSELNYDLYDLTVWERIFLSDPQLADDDDVSDPRELERLKVDESTLRNGEAGDQLIDLPSSWVEPLTLNRMQFENQFPGRRKTVRYADATIEYFAEYSDRDLRVMVVRVPDDQTLHGEQVHTLFKYRKDLLRRESVYPSPDRVNAPRKRHEWYLPGRKKDSRVEGLREIIDEPGIQRTLRFWWRSREDGLASRTELFFDAKDPHPKKIIELYRGRTEDRLWYRSATYEPSKDGPGPGAIGLPGPHLSRGDQQPLGRDSASELTRQPMKMTEKFRRNPNVKATSDVMKRTFIRPLHSDGEVWVWYHYTEDCITRGYRLYPKVTDRDRDITASNDGVTLQAKVVVMPFEEPPRAHTIREEVKALIAAEKDCLNEIRAKTKECHEILLGRSTAAAGQDQDAESNRILSVYDTLRNRPQETEAERERIRREEHRRAESRKDYLAPYIANLDIEKGLKGDYTNVKLSVQHAKQVRDSALKDLKERLIQRGHIMQARMDKEKEELNKRQIAYQKNLDSTENAKDSDDFAKFLNQATWRMKILDDRLTRHIEQASEKYAELAQKLAADPRLSAIYETPSSTVAAK